MPRARVWRALTDAEQFGQLVRRRCWRARSRRARRARGRITHPGYEHVTLEITVEKMEPERLLLLPLAPVRRRPQAVDYSAEPTTLVVFSLEEADGGTLLTVVESGFDKVPAARRAKAFRMNSEGWAAQMKNIERHVAARAEA